jgi:uncharacterized membrane protein YfcA
MLLFLFGVNMHHAVATSIITVIATSSAVASVNVERGTANMRLGMTLEIATSIGAISGGWIVAQFSTELLEAMFAFVLIPTAALMWRKRKAGAEMIALEESPTGSKYDSIVAPADSNLGLLGDRYFDPQLGHEVSYRIERLWAGLGISSMAGVLSGMLGIGGGVFKVPALHLLCNVPIKAAAATSNFMIGVTATASAFLYFGRGEVRPALTAAVVLGVLVGSGVGSIVNRYIRGRLVNQLFAVVLAAVAVQMLFRAFGG